MTTTYQVKPNSDEWEVWETTSFYSDDSERVTFPGDKTEVVFESRALADCAAFIQLRTAGHI